MGKASWSPGRGSEATWTGRDQADPGTRPSCQGSRYVSKAVVDTADQPVNSDGPRREQVDLTAEPCSHSWCMKLPCLHKLV